MSHMETFSVQSFWQSCRGRSSAGKCCPEGQVGTQPMLCAYYAYSSNTAEGWSPASWPSSGTPPKPDVPTLLPLAETEPLWVWLNLTKSSMCRKWQWRPCTAYVFFSSDTEQKLRLFSISTTIYWSGRDSAGLRHKLCCHSIQPLLQWIMKEQLLEKRRKNAA